MKKAGIFLAVIGIFFILSLSIVSASCLYKGKTYSSGSTAWISGKCYKCSGSTISKVDACKYCGKNCPAPAPQPTCESAGGCRYNGVCYSSGTIVTLSDGRCVKCSSGTILGPSTAYCPGGIGTAGGGGPTTPACTPSCPAASTVTCGQALGSDGCGGTCSGTGTQCPSGQLCSGGSCCILQTWYRDADHDGYGNLTSSTTACSQPLDYVNNSNDADDNDATIYPGAPEICDNKDNNQNGATDEGCDDDSDSYADETIACSINFLDGNGFVRLCSINGGDCNDTNPLINPATIWYLDADADGYGNPNINITNCTQPAGGYVLTDGDINDSSNVSYPGAPELCDGLDNNYDSVVDEGCDYSITIISPQNIFYNTSIIEFNVTYNQAGGTCNYSLDGGVSYYSMSSVSPTNFYAIDNSIPDGAHNVLFNCWNSYNVFNSTSTGFIVDTTAPFLSIIDPIATIYNTQILSMIYTVFDAALATCWYSLDNGTTNTTVLCGQPILGITSTDGWNTWAVYASDAAGNVGNASVTFLVDTTAPTLTILNPASDGLWFGSANIPVEYIVSDSVGLDSCWWTSDNGNTNNSIICGVNITGQTWIEGANAVEICANDTVGNMGCTARTFNIDLSAPVITILNPITADIVGWDVILRADVVDPNIDITGVTYEIINNSNSNVLASGALNDMGGNIFNGTFSTTDVWPYDSFAWNSADLTFVVYARDSFLHESNASSNFVLDNSLPSIQHIMPTQAGSFVNSNFSLDIRVQNHLLNYTSYAIEDSYGGVWIFNRIDLAQPSYTWNDLVNVDSLPEGNYTVATFARDSSMPIQNSFGKGTWFYVDRTVPSIDIASPQNTTYNYACIDVTINAEGENTWFVWNGMNYTYPYAGCFNFTEGSNTLDAYTQDLAGNLDSASVTFFVDSIAPDISFVEPPTPASGGFFNANDISTSVISSDLGSGLTSIAINLYDSAHMLIDSNTSITSPLDTTFVTPIDGIYYFNATACDNAGNCASTETRTVTIDTTPPALSIIYPENNSYNYVITELNYTILEINPDTCMYSIDGGATMIPVACGDNVTGLISNEGSNTWMIWANDSAGNSAQDDATFFVDSIAPVVAITNPASDGMSFNADNISIDFSASDANLQNCWWTRDAGVTNNSIACTDSITGQTWSQGSNTATVYADDVVGNIGSATRTFNVDTVSPIITATSPVNGGAYNYTLILVNISVDNGDVWFSNGTYTWPINVGPLFIDFPEGNNTISIYANDSAGNTAEMNITFLVDSIAPLVIITYPSQDSLAFNLNNIPVNYIASDPHLQDCWWTSDGGLDNPIACGDNITGQIWAEGVHSASVFARDALNNIGSATRNFSIDTVPPIVSITSPSDINYSLPDIIFDVNTNEIADWCGISIDGAANVSMTTSNGTVLQEIIGGIPDGSHTAIASCNDSAGNTNYASTSFSIDTIFPLISIISPQNITYNSTEILVNISASDANLYLIWFNLNGNAINYTAALSLNFTEGINVFDAFAADFAGNTAQAEVIFIVSIERTIVNSMIYGEFYPNNLTSEVTTTTVSNSTVNDSIIANISATVVPITDSWIYNSTLTDLLAIDHCIAIDSVVQGGMCVFATIDPSNITSDNVTGSVITDSFVYYYDVVWSRIINSTIYYSHKDHVFMMNSYAFNSTELYSNETYSTINNSFVMNSNISHSIIINSNITGSNVDWSNITNSTVYNSNISHSTILNSTIISSNISHSTVINSTVITSTVSNSTIINSTIINSTILNSTVTNSIVTNSTIVNSNITNANVSNANITNNVICSGNLTFNGTTYDADLNGCENLTDLINYPPMAVLSISPASAQTGVNIGFNGASSSDPNIPGDLGDSLTFTFVFGDGTNVSGTTNQVVHSYSAAGTYNAALIVTDSFGESSTATGSVQITSGGAGPGGPGGGTGVPYMQPIVGSNIVYQPTAEELLNGFNVLLKEKQLVKMIIESRVYYFGISYLNSSVISAYINPRITDRLWDIGQDRRDDLSQDGYIDLSTKLNNITGEFANLTFTRILKPGQTAEDVKHEPVPGEESFFSKFLKNWLVPIIIAIIIIAGIVAIILYRKRLKGRKTENVRRIKQEFKEQERELVEEKPVRAVKRKSKSRKSKR